MADIYPYVLSPLTAVFAASTFPQLLMPQGTSFPVPGLAFDAAADETAYWDVRALGYGSGNVSLEVDWYADTASSGDVVWEGSIAAITADSDTTDVETKSFATAVTVTDSHLGTTGQRVHRATVAVSNLDSLAANDDLRIRIRRLGSSGSDTMSGDAILLRATVKYSDT